MTAEGSRTLYWSIAIAATIVVAFFSKVFSITHGIYDIFPFLYFLPIILFVYFYPDKGILFTVALSSVYLVLVCTLSNLNSVLVAVSTAWFVIFVTIGVVTSSLAGGLRTEERKYRGLFENSQAGIFIFDLATVRVTDTNARYAHMFRYEVDDLIGKDLTRILLESAETGRSGDSVIHLYTRDGSVRQFLISASLTPTNMVICSAIDITDQKLAEQVIQKAREDLEIRVRERTEDLLQSNEELRTEILERKKFEDAIQLANRKLNTLSNITRHDNLNQITAIVMYLSLTEELSDNPALVTNLKKIGKITQLIQKQIQFTRDYQNIGASSPQWQNVTAVVSEAIAEVDLSGLRVECDTGELEIYADLLLGKVFYNLVENAICHGEKAAVIRFSYEQSPNGLDLICEDDGVGIPAAQKDRIFKREYYRNTKYGLFLAEEILSITGIGIREEGVPGRGARFVISIPAGAFRFPGQMDGPGAGSANKSFE